MARGGYSPLCKLRAGGATCGKTRTKIMGRPFVDETGHLFGDWTVLGRAPDALNGIGQIRYFVRCACGAEAIRQWHSLKRGVSKSCGCRVSREIKDEAVGQQFNEWTILDISPGTKTSSPVCLVRCSCGAEKWRNYFSIRSGHSQSCGCKDFYACREELRPLLSGDKFGELTIIKRDVERTLKPFYLCACSCGKEITVFKHTLTSGKKSSCGHDGQSTVRDRSFKDLESCLKMRCKSSLKRAVANGWDFNISPEWLAEKYDEQFGCCYFSGIELTYAPGDYSISLDRRNSMKGYTRDNVVLVCTMINMMKSSMAEIKFLTLCRRVAANVPTHDQTYDATKGKAAVVVDPADRPNSE